jgi:hypothetical protein
MRIFLNEVAGIFDASDLSMWKGLQPHAIECFRLNATSFIGQTIFTGLLANAASSFAPSAATKSLIGPVGPDGI